MSTKEKLAYALAQYAHEGQKYGEHDYFHYHVRGVAENFSPEHGGIADTSKNVALWTCSVCGVPLSTTLADEPCSKYDSDAYIVALLYDVVEDSDIDMSVIFDLFGKKIGFAIMNITRYPDQEYDEYIEEMGDHLAIKVKIADLKFNLNQPNPRNVERYTKALEILENKQ